MSAETLSDKITGAICRRIKVDFGAELGTSTSLDKLSLEECSQFIAIADKDSQKWTVFATIDISCRRSDVGEYETTVQAEMRLVGLTEEELARLSLEETILKKYRALEPTVTTSTKRWVSRALAALFAGDRLERRVMPAFARQMRGGSEEDETFVDRRVTVSFSIAKLTTELKDVIAGGSWESFDAVAKTASERVRVLREIHESVEP